MQTELKQSRHQSKMPTAIQSRKNTSKFLSDSSEATVLVVGAGPSGLAALKELNEAGLQTVVVDSRCDFGGVFAPSSGVTYEKLYLTTTNMFMAYSDFPPKDKSVKYWSKQQYYEYLHSYVANFNLEPSIHLGTTVVRAELKDGGLWRVVFRTSDGEEVVRAFQYMVVATGANHIPFVPREISEQFSGELLHSQQYTSPEQVREKKVLVIGTGESSADVVKSAATTAENVTVWSRRFPNVAPRFLTECLDDSKYDEEAYFLRQDDGNHTRLPRDFLEAVTTSRIVRNMPLAIWSAVLQKGLFSTLTENHGDKSPPGLKADWCLNRFESDFFSGDTSSVPTKSLMICTAVANRDVDLVVAPRIRFDGMSSPAKNQGTNTVVFEKPSYFGIQKTTTRDDISLDVDVIVACTGFKTSFDWIEVPGLATDANPRFWFKHCFPTKEPLLSKKIAFLGHARPHQGGIPQCAEMLARYVAQIASGRRTLPDNYRELALSEGKCEEDCYHLSQDVLPLVDYPAFMLSVARLVGCEPAVPIHSIRGMVQYWTFPLWSCFFRTAGEGAKPEACQAVLDKFDTFDGVAPMPLCAVEVVLTFFLPIINFVSFVFEQLVFDNNSRVGLPFLYRWRMSKLNFLSGNYLRWSDFGAPLLAQLVAGWAIIFYGVNSIARSAKNRSEADMKLSFETPVNLGEETESSMSEGNDEWPTETTKKVK